jgi:hypothetical protein
MQLAIFDVALVCSVLGYVWHKLSFFVLHYIKSSLVAVQTYWTSCCVTSEG